MFENLAYQYSDLPEDQVRSIGYGLIIVGGLVGGLTNRSITEIRRAHYFALSGLIFLCMAVVTYSGMTVVVSAIVNEVYWVVVAADMLAAVIGGFFFARIAADRSRDAYGHGRMAPLAFIPFANLWLLLTPSKNEISANRSPAIPLLTGGLGVLSGFFLLSAGVGFSVYAQEDGKRRVEEAATAGVFNVAMLDRNLATMAADVQTPIVVDETTTLVRMASQGPELRYVYTVDPPPDFLPPDMRIGLIRQNCSFDGLTAVLDAGAVIKHVYNRIDGTEIGVVEVTRQVCGR